MWHVGKVRNWHNSYWQHGLSFLCVYVSIYISIYYLGMYVYNFAALFVPEKRVYVIIYMKKESTE